MSQIITVHIGNCGTNLGLKFWQQLSSTKQQNLSQQELFKNEFHYDKFFTETLDGKSIPKCVFADTDVRSKQRVKLSKINFDLKQCLSHQSSCCNLFGQGLYISGALMIDQIIESIRKQAQRCDLLSGFILTQSPAGGAGSGLGSNILSKLRQNYCDKIVQDIKILPGPDSSFSLRHLNPLQIYNIILSTHYGIQNTDLIYCFQNNAVSRILSKKGLAHTSFSDINKFMASCINSHISAYLQPGKLNTNQRKRATNLVLFPRIKHLCGSKGNPGTGYLQSALQHKNKLMILPSANDSRIYSSAFHIRDRLASQNEINKIIANWAQVTQNKFVDWLPCSYHISLGQPDHKQNENAWALFNGSHNISWIKPMSELYTNQFRRKAFIHHYTSLGMDQMQFTQAESNCNDLISQYTPYENYILDQEDYEEAW